MCTRGGKGGGGWGELSSLLDVTFSPPAPDRLLYSEKQTTDTSDESFLYPPSCYVLTRRPSPVAR